MSDVRNAAGAVPTDDEPVVSAVSTDDELDENAGERSGDESADDSASSDDNEGEQQQQARRRGGVQKRIDTLTRQLRTAQAQIAQITAKPAAAATEQPKPVVPDAKDDPEPDPDSKNPDGSAKYQTLRDFTKAQAQWEARDLRRQEMAAEANAKTQREERAAAESFGKRIAAATERYEDFEDVALNPTLPITKGMYEVISNSELGEDVLYHLGKYPAEAARIAALQDPRAIARELGKIEGRLASQQEHAATSTAADEDQSTDDKPARKAPTPPITRAPKPPTPITRAASGVAITDPVDAAMKGDFRQFEKLRAKQERER